uniref:Uncharacterized protein n=1 Tax=Ixodes ricinus TaxID=34613 RepID=A0A6B0U0R5_IXORI
MGTYLSPLPDCPAGTAFLTMHVILLASYLVISSPCNVSAECRKWPAPIWSAGNGAKPQSVPLTDTVN